VWLLVKLFRLKSRITFEGLIEVVGIMIMMTWVVGFIGAIMGTLVIEIYRYCPWLPVILGGFWIVIGLVSLINYSTTKARERQGQTPSYFPAQKARFRTTVQRIWARGPAGGFLSPPARCEVSGIGITG